MTISEYLKRVKERLLDDPIVSSFHVVRERATLSDGFVRIRLTLKDGGFLEFSEYVQFVSKDRVEVITYSYHWADSDGGLIRRWDNTPHFPGLSGFPHHVHIGMDDVIPGRKLSIFVVLDEIASYLA
jgi:hypothetical protein